MAFLMAFLMVFLMGFLWGSYGSLMGLLWDPRRSYGVLMGSMWGYVELWIPLTLSDPIGHHKIP